MVYALRHVQICMAFSSRVKTKHGKLAGNVNTAAYHDDPHYRTVCGNFMLTNSICDFLTQNGYVTVQCWLVLFMFCIKQLGEASRLLDPILKINNPTITNNFYS